MITLDFTGKNVIVTGAGSGIGRAIALQFAKADANVWIGEIQENNGQESLSQMQSPAKPGMCVLV